MSSSCTLRSRPRLALLLALLVLSLQVSGLAGAAAESSGSLSVTYSDLHDGDLALGTLEEVLFNYSIIATHEAGLAAYALTLVATPAAGGRAVPMGFQTASLLPQMAIQFDGRLQFTESAPLDDYNLALQWEHISSSANGTMSLGVVRHLAPTSILSLRTTSVEISDTTSDTAVRFEVSNDGSVPAVLVLRAPFAGVEDRVWVAGGGQAAAILRLNNSSVNDDGTLTITAGHATATEFTTYDLEVTLVEASSDVVLSLDQPLMGLVASSIATVPSLSFSVLVTNRGTAPSENLSVSVIARRTSGDILLGSWSSTLGLTPGQSSPIPWSTPVTPAPSGAYSILAVASDASGTQSSLYLGSVHILSPDQKGSLTLSITQDQLEAGVPFTVNGSIVTSLQEADDITVSLQLRTSTGAQLDAVSYTFQDVTISDRSDPYTLLVPTCSPTDLLLHGSLMTSSGAVLDTLILPLVLASTTTPGHALTGFDAANSIVAAGDPVSTILSITSSAGDCESWGSGSFALLQGETTIETHGFQFLLPGSRTDSTHSVALSFQIPDNLPDGLYDIEASLHTSHRLSTDSFTIKVVSNRVGASLACDPIVHGFLSVECTITNQGSISKRFTHSSEHHPVALPSEWVTVAPGDSVDVLLDLPAWSEDRGSLSISLVTLVGSDLIDLDALILPLPLAGDGVRSGSLDLGEDPLARVGPDDSTFLSALFRGSLDLLGLGLDVDVLVDDLLVQELEFVLVSREALIHLRPGGISHCDPADLLVIVMLSSDGSEITRATLPLDDCGVGELADLEIGDVVFGGADGSTILVSVGNVGARETGSSFTVRAVIDGLSGSERSSALEPGEWTQVPISLGGEIDWSIDHSIDIVVDSEREVIEITRYNNRILSHLSAIGDESSSVGVDSDGDGLPDSLETTPWTVSYCPDVQCLAALQAAMWSGGTDDGHGIISNYLSTSDPDKADTDGDGLSDAFEWIHGSAADRADSDFDGIPDGEEVLAELLVPPSVAPGIQLLTYTGSGYSYGRSASSTPIDSIKFSITSTAPLGVVTVSTDDGSVFTPSFVRSESAEVSIYSVQIPSRLTPEVSEGAAGGEWPLITATTVFGASSAIEANASSADSKRWSTSRFSSTLAIATGALAGIGLTALGAAIGFCIMAAESAVDAVLGLWPAIIFILWLLASGLLDELIDELSQMSATELLEMFLNADLLDWISPFEGAAHESFRAGFIAGAIVALVLFSVLLPSSVITKSGKLARGATDAIPMPGSVSDVRHLLPSKAAKKGLTGEAKDAAYPGAKPPKVFTRAGDNALRNSVQQAIIRETILEGPLEKIKLTSGLGVPAGVMLDNPAVVKAIVLTRLKHSANPMDDVKSFVNDYKDFLKSKQGGGSLRTKQISQGELAEYLALPPGAVVGPPAPSVAPKQLDILDFYSNGRPILYDVYMPDSSAMPGLSTTDLGSKVRTWAAKVAQVENDLDDVIVKAQTNSQTPTSTVQGLQAWKVARDQGLNADSRIMLVGKHAAGKSAAELAEIEAKTGIKITVASNNADIVKFFKKLAEGSLNSIQLVGFEVLELSVAEDDSDRTETVSALLMFAACIIFAAAVASSTRRRQGPLEHDEGSARNQLVSTALLVANLSI